MEYPTIFYWKWDDGILEPGVMEEKLGRILNQTNFSMLYLSFHHMSLSITDPRLLSLAARCGGILRRNGRGLMLDIDARAELDGYLQSHPDGRAMTVSFIERTLDRDGNCRFTLPNPARRHTGRAEETAGPAAVLGCWAFTPAGNTAFLPQSLTKAPCVFENHGDAAKFSVSAGPQNGGKTVLVAAAYPFTIPDIFAEDFSDYYESLFQKAAHIPLAGVANDEWGFDLTIKWDPEKSFWVDDFPYTPSFSRQYRQKAGIPLEEALLYLARRPLGDEGKSVAAIAAYTETLRDGMRRNNDWFYEAGKRCWGPDTFIGVHPTLWGDFTDSSLDILHNGLDWWEVRRDYAQTDEFIAMPVRLALAHKWRSPVWYNMWYGSGTQQFDTYLRESWRNARFGGRTHYLGYECPNEGNVYALKTPGDLEQLNRMEDKIAALGRFVSGQPDSRVLTVFGMEAVSDWLDNFGGPQIVRSTGRMRRVLQFASDLFEHCLCDLVPSSEAANGSLLLEGGKIRYGSQQYDAVILLEPQYLHPDAYTFFREYAARGGKLLLGGSCTLLSNGEPAPDFAGIPAKRLSSLSVSEAIGVLKEWQIPFHTAPGGCRFQDGTWVFTSPGVWADGNALEVSARLDGHTVEFLGDDFLAVRFGPEGTEAAYGSVRFLKIDGKEWRP